MYKHKKEERVKEFVNSFTNYLFVLTEYDMLKNAQNGGNHAGAKHTGKGDPRYDCPCHK